MPESIDFTAWDPATGYTAVDDLVRTALGLELGQSCDTSCGCNSESAQGIPTVPISGIG